MHLKDYLKSLETKKYHNPDFGDITFSRSTPTPKEEIEKKEKEFGFSLPKSFKEFLEFTGSPVFFNVGIFSASDLYQFDEDCWEMEGFVPFAQDSSGNYFAFKPIPDQDEYPVFKCSHDPFGYGKVSDSFLEWMKVHISYLESIEKEESDFSHPYLEVEEEIDESFRRYKASQPKKWWQFWK